jgi:spermidine synthase
MPRPSWPRPSRPDHILVFSVFVVASSGLAYELVSAALASYLLGDSVLQFSTVIGCYLFAMGVGSHLSRFVRDASLLRVFIEVELLIALSGGLSATLLFLLFGAPGLSFRAVLYALVFCVGLLVGSEIPLVMRLLELRKRDTGLALGDMLSRVLTFDYLGALVVSLLFPLLLAPWLGMARTALAFGLLNTLVALYTLHAFRAELPHSRGLLLRALGVLAVLLGALAASPLLTGWSERRLYGDEILHAQSSPYQRLVLTRWRDDLRLYLNGELQFSSRDEYRYHEALVHPALESLARPRRVLILGGGDGLAAREVLRYAEVERVVLVDLDAMVTKLFAQQPELLALNANALNDARVSVVNSDAGLWLEANDEVFDAILVDLPDPTSFALGKLYSVPFYRLLARHLAPGGRVAVQATSPYYAPHAYWCVVASLGEAGLSTWPYHVYVPSFGEWGFVLASAHDDFTPPAHYRLPLRYLDAQTGPALFRFAPDLARPLVQANQLDSQALVHYYERDWRNVVR